MAPFPFTIESDLTDYQGTMATHTFEGPGPIFSPKNVIRSDQNWGVKVDWQVTGPLVEWLDAEFRLNVYLESIGTGPEFDLPTVVVATLSMPVVVDGAGVKSRTYSQNVDIAAGTIPAGVYKIATTLHLYERATGNPTPIAGFVEGRMVNIFDPK